MGFTLTGLEFQWRSSHIETATQVSWLFKSLPAWDPWGTVSKAQWTLMPKDSKVLRFKAPMEVVEKPSEIHLQIKFLDGHWCLLMVFDGHWCLLDGYWMVIGWLLDAYWWFLIVMDGHWCLLDGYWMVIGCLLMVFDCHGWLLDGYWMVIGCLLMVFDGHGWLLDGYWMVIIYLPMFFFSQNSLVSRFHGHPGQLLSGFLGPRWGWRIPFVVAAWLPIAGKRSRKIRVLGHATNGYIHDMYIIIFDHIHICIYALYV